MAPGAFCRLSVIVLITVSRTVQVASDEDFLEAISSYLLPYLIVNTSISYNHLVSDIEVGIPNDDLTAQAIGFEMSLPKEAFVKFVGVKIGGAAYKGQLRERPEEESLNKTPAHRIRSAMHLSISPPHRYAKKYQFFVPSIEPEKKVEFKVRLEAVLKQEQREYKFEMFATLNTPLKLLRMNTLIKGEGGVEVDTSRPLDMEHQRDGDGIVMNLNPSFKKLVGRANTSVSLELYESQILRSKVRQVTLGSTVWYTLGQSKSMCEMLTKDGFFVQYLRPPRHTIRYPQDIIFVLDASGSMHRNKLNYLKEGMVNILSKLKGNDRFNIISYGDNLDVWKLWLKKATPCNIKGAQSYVRNMTVRGRSDIYGAFKYSFHFFNSRGKTNRHPIIFFVTDGMPSIFEQNMTEILNMISQENDGSVSIFSLALGHIEDLRFLNMISEQNYGFVRIIDDAPHAALQILAAYDEITQISTKGLSVNYAGSVLDENSVPMISKRVTNVYGSETHVLGLFKETRYFNETFIMGWRSYDDQNSRLVHWKQFFCHNATSMNHLTKRLWLLNYMAERDSVFWSEGLGKAERERLVNVSLENNFLIPFTSFVFNIPDVDIQITETQMRFVKPTDLSFQTQWFYTNASLYRRLRQTITTPDILNFKTLQPPEETQGKRRVTSTTTTGYQTTRSKSQATLVAVLKNATANQRAPMFTTKQRTPSQQASTVTTTKHISTVKPRTTPTVKPRTTPTVKPRTTPTVKQKPKILVRALVLNVSKPHNYDKTPHMCFATKNVFRGNSTYAFIVFSYKHQNVYYGYIELYDYPLVMIRFGYQLNIHIDGSKLWHYSWSPDYEDRGFRRLVKGLHSPTFHFGLNKHFVYIKLTGFEVRIKRNFYRKANRVHYKVFITTEPEVINEATDITRGVFNVNWKSREENPNTVAGCQREPTRYNYYLYDTEAKKQSVSYLSEGLYVPGYNETSIFSNGDI